jgi:hypothetical protein
LIDYRFFILFSNLNLSYHLIIEKVFINYKDFSLYFIKNLIPQTNFNNRKEDSNSKIISKKIELN